MPAERSRPPAAYGPFRELLTKFESASSSLPCPFCREVGSLHLGSSDSASGTLPNFVCRKRQQPLTHVVLARLLEGNLPSTVPTTELISQRSTLDSEGPSQLSVDLFSTLSQRPLVFEHHETLPQNELNAQRIELYEQRRHLEEHKQL